MSETEPNVHAVHHVSVVVADCSRALVFYRDILGLEVMPDRPDLGYPGAWLALGKSNQQQIHLLEFPEKIIIQASGGRQDEHPGHGPHLALAVNNLSEIRSSLERKNIDYSVSRSGRPALFCRDYDGNIIELIENSKL